MENHIKKIQKYLHNGRAEDMGNRIERLIRNQSSKATTHFAFDELLKDADVLQHCLYNPLFPVMEHEKCRFQNLLIEFGISKTV